MTGYKSKAKGYTVKIVDGKPVFVPEKPKFRKSLAQRQKAKRAVRIARRGAQLI